MEWVHKRSNVISAFLFVSTINQPGNKVISDKSEQIVCEGLYIRSSSPKLSLSMTISSAVDSLGVELGLAGCHFAFILSISTVRKGLQASVLSLSCMAILL
jgi:hypothetical protein